MTNGRKFIIFEINENNVNDFSITEMCLSVVYIYGFYQVEKKIS